MYAICTGAGAGFQPALRAEPGELLVLLLGALVPRTRRGKRPASWGSRRSASQAQTRPWDLAMAAYMRARRGPGEACGLAMTASAASLKAHRGDDNGHACAVTDTAIRGRGAALEKGEGREQREKDGRLLWTPCASSRAHRGRRR